MDNPTPIAGASPSPLKLPRAARIGRRLYLLGFAGLAVSLFLPQTDWFRPLDLLRGHPPSGERYLVLLTFPFLYAFAMLVVAIGPAPPHGLRRARAFLHAGCALTLAAFFAYDAALAVTVGKIGWPSGLTNTVIVFSLVAGAGVGTTLTVAAWIRAPAAARVGACVAAAGFAFVGFFLSFTIPEFDNARSGGWLSLVASGLVAVGGMIEAGALWDFNPPVPPAEGPAP